MSAYHVPDGLESVVDGDRIYAFIYISIYISVCVYFFFFFFTLSVF